MIVAPAELAVLHIGAGRYPVTDAHPNYAIWRELAKGFRRYAIVARSKTNKDVTITEGNLSIFLLASRFASETEFLFTQWRAYQIALAQRPDVVVSQCPVQGGLVAAKIKRKIGAKILAEFHMSHYFDSKRVFSRAQVLETATRFNLPNVDRVRVLSAGMRDDLIKRYRYRGAVSVLPPRVDLNRFKNVKKSWEVRGSVKVVLVGSVIARKGQLKFLQAVLPRLRSIEVWIVGDGRDLKACQDYVRETGSEERVRFFGRVDHDALAELLPRADIMVLFSSMEGTPRVLMEGLAVGLPVVTTNAGYCNDVVTQGIDGLVLGDDPESEIVAVLKRLIGDGDLRARIGLAGRQRVEREYNAEVLYPRYRALIAETAFGG